MSTAVMVERIAEASPRFQARIAGVFYLLVFLTGGVAVPSFRLVVGSDAAATASNILAHEALFRLGFAALLIIFALSLKNLGPYTIGGAIFPALMGYISDRTNIREAFVVPLLCHIYVLYFAARGYKPILTAAQPEPAVASLGQA